MNSALLRRVSAIEALSGGPDDFIMIRVTFVAPNNPVEIQSCTLLGQPGRFVRAEEETEEAFMERVTRQARATREPGQMVAVALIPAAVEHEEGA